MLEIDHNLSLSDREFSASAIRSQGAGGQNVNKVATAIALRFSIPESSLPEDLKERLLKLNDRRVNKDGVFVLKVQDSRSQDRNYQLARERLAEFIRRGSHVPKRRVATRPGKAARQKRMDEKNRRSEVKAQRSRPRDF